MSIKARRVVNSLTTRILFALGALMLSVCSGSAQTITVQRYNSTDGWSNTLATASTVAFPTAAAGSATLEFRIQNTGAATLNLTGTPVVAKSGANAAEYSITQPAVNALAPGASTTFSVTYTPGSTGVRTAQLSIANNSATNPFVLNLKGASWDFYGPQSPPIGTISSTSTGEAGRSGGRNVLITGVSLGTLTTAYWGPQISATGDFKIKVSLDGSTYTNNETLTLSAAETNLANGKAVWRGSTFIQNAISFSTQPVTIRATLTTRRTDNSIVPMVDPTTHGLSEQVGGLVLFSTLSDYLVANFFIEASTNGGATWTPYLDFYDAYPTPLGPLPGAGIGNAYSSITSGFYWVNLAPKLSANNVLNVNEGGTATISTAFLNATDSEDLPANPGKIVFSFSSTGPLNFGTGVLKKSGVAMTAASTFTLQDIQNGLITFEHNGSETVYDEFQFNFKDSKNKLGADGSNTVYTFKINIIPVNDAPITRDTTFTTTYAPVPMTRTLVATDPDNTPAQLTYSIITAPTKGVISGFNAATGQFTYTPNFGAPTTDFFTYRVSDGTDNSNISTVNIIQVNMAPASSSSSIVTMEDVAVSGTLTATDPEGSAVTFQLAQAPSKGAASLGANGSYTYTPSLSKFGPDYFVFKVSDAQGTLSAGDTVFVRIIPRLDPGDIIVVDKTVLRLFDPVTGQDTTLTKDQGMTDAINVAYRKGSSLFMFDKTNGLIKAHPVTGVQSLVSARGNFSAGGPIGGVAGMLLNDAGRLILADGNKILSVDSSSGAVTTLFTGGLLTFPTGLVYLNNGDLIVTDAGLITGGASRIIRITPAGVQSVLASGGLITLPLDLALIDQNTAVVSDGGSFAGATDNLYKVNLTTGALTPLSSGGNIGVPSGLDYRLNKLYVVNNQGKHLLDVNPNSGAQAVLPGSDLFEPWGLLVVQESITVTATSATNETCAGASNGTASISFSGGLAPYFYQLNGGTSVAVASSPITLSNLAPGTYSLLIGESTGASTTTSFTIAAGNPLPAATTGSATTICAGSPVQIGAAAVAGNTYAWTSNPAGFTSNLANPSVSPSVTTTYMLTETVTATGCSRSNSVTITVTPLAQVNAPADVVYCNGSTTAPVSFTGTGTSYTWTNSNTAIGLGASGTGDIAAFTATNTSTAPITATITVTPRTSMGALYVYGSNSSFGIIDPSTLTLTTVPTPGSNNQAEITESADGSTIYASSLGANLVYVIDAASRTVINTISVNTPTMVKLSPDGSKLYVASFNTGNLYVYNTAGYSLSATIAVGAGAYGVMLSPDGSKVYTTQFGAGTVAVVNTATNTVTNTLSGMTNAAGIALSPDGSKLYVGANGNFHIINTSTNTIQTSISIPGTTMYGIALNNSGSTAYVSLTSLNRLAVINLASNTVLTQVAGVTFPWGVAISSDNSKVYVANFSGGNVSILNTSSNTFTGSVPYTAPTAVLYSNSNSCAGTARTFTITVNPKPSWNNGGFSTSFCNNQGIGFSISNGGNVPGADYTWTNDNPAIGTPATGSGNSLSFTGTNTGTTNIAGNFVVTPSYTNGGLTCTGTPGNFTVTVKPTPTVNAVANQTVCKGQVVSGIIFSGSVSGTNFSWINNNTSIGLAASGTGGVLPAFTAVNNGTTVQTATITVTPDANGCSGSSITFTITVNPQPIVAFAYTGSPYCQSGTATPSNSGTPGGTYTSTAGLVINATTGAIDLAASTPGNYTVTYTIAASGGCSQVQGGAPVTIQSRAVITQPGDQTVCGGSSTSAVNFSGSNGSGFTWTNDNPAIGLAASGTGNIPAFTATNSGSTNVTATITVNMSANAGFCPAAPKTFTITVTPQRSAAISYAGSPYCSGPGTATPTFSGTPGGTYSSTAGLSINAASGAVNIAASTAGTYTVTYTIPAAGVCPQVTASTNITINPPVTATITASGPTTICPGGSVTLSAPATPGATYLWSNGATTSGITVSAAGNYSVTVTSNGCVANGGPVTVSVNPTPTVNAVANQALCTSAVSTAVSFSGSVAGTVYNWTNSNPSIGLAGSGSGDIASFTTANSTSTVQTAAITVTPSYTNGGSTCTGTAVTFTITVNPVPTVNAITSQNLCNGANTTAVTFSGSVPGTVFNWTNNTPSIGLGAGGSGNIASFPAVNSGTAPVTALITVTPSYTNGGTSCPGTAASFSITVNPTPTVNAVASQVLCNSATSAAVTFSGTVTNTAYTWTNSNPSIGLASSGSGNIAPFAAVNNGTAPVTATITVTPQATLSGRAYVPNNTSGTVSMIDLATGAVVGSPITVGANPFGIAVLPDRSKVFVSNTGGNSVSVINTSTNTVTGTSPYNAPHGLAASPDGTRVYVNGWTDNAVSWINVATNGSTFMTNVTQPEGMAVSADGARLYVASSTNPGKLVVINTANNSILASINVGNFPQGVALSADGSKVYVVNNGSASLSVIGTATNSVIATIPVGSNPLGVAVSPDGSKVYVTNSGNNNVSVINTATNTVGASIPVGTYPYGVSVSPDGSTVYVANRNSNNVSIIHAATNAVSNVAVGTAPIALGQFTTASLQCAGTPATFTITVNPTPTVNAVTNQTHCAGATTTAVNFSGAVPGTVYSWTNSNPSIGLAAGGTGNIAAFTATNSTSTVQTATITVTPSYTNGGQTCSGTPVTFTITVNPTPSVAAVANQVVCNGAATAAANFSGPVSGTTYSWTNSNASIGLGASGSGNIVSFNAVNTGTTVQTATITVTPSANGCPGAAQTFTITVNPTPTVNGIANQALCNGATTSAVSFSGTVSGTVYNWTNNNTAIGLAAGGSGDIGAFTATNMGATPAVATISVMPVFTNAGQTCSGSAASFTITVNPTPTVAGVPNQTVCNGAATTAVTFSGAVTGTTYSWMNDNPSIGLAASGTGDIASFTAANSTTAPVTATVTVTPTANACGGTAQTFTITVNPTPSLSALTPVTVCAGQTITVPNFSGPVAATSFNWSNDNTSIGLGASGTGNIAPFTAVNNGTAPLVANVTVTPTANGCPGTQSTITITVNPLPTGTITAPNGTLICPGTALPLQVTGGTSYQWFLDGNAITGATAATFNATQPGTYTVNITNAQGCTRAASNNMVLTLVQKPVAGFGFSSYCLNTPVLFSNTTGTAGSGTVTYQWSFGNGQVSTQQTPTVTYGAVGNYTVQLVASPNGCAGLNDTARQTIRIEAPLPGTRLPAVDVVSGRPTEIHARNQANAHYSWTPATGLSNPSIWYPVATLSQEQEYRIQMSFASGCVTVDTLLVRVQKGDDIFVPTAFSPDGDGVNDVLKPITVGLTTFRYFRVYDQLGREVFSTTSVNQGWDGTFKGQPLPARTYIWVTEGRDSNGNIIRKTGQVALLR